MGNEQTAHVHAHAHAHADGIVHAHGHSHGDHDHDHEHDVRPLAMLGDGRKLIIANAEINRERFRSSGYVARKRAG